MKTIALWLAVVIGTLAALTVPASADFFGLGWRSASTKADECFGASIKDPEFQALATRLGYGGNPSIDQLSDATMPSDADAALVLKFAERRMPCRTQMLAALDEYHPAMSSAYEVRYFQQDVVYVELLKKRISFGEATKRLHASWLEFSQRYDRYSAKMEAIERQQLAEQLDQLSQTFQNFGKPQNYGPYGTPYGAPGGAPVPYTCRWIGPSIYCDPY